MTTIEDDLNDENDLKNDYHLKNKDNLKYEDDLKNEDNLKNEDDLKNEGNLKNWPSSPNYSAPNPPLKKLPEIFLMTSHLDSHTTTDVKLSCYQVSKPEMEFHMIDMIYAALPMHA